MRESIRMHSFIKNGYVIGPNVIVDKGVSFSLTWKKCTSCNFNNQIENIEVCPLCGQSLVLMKEKNDEAVK